MGWEDGLQDFDDIKPENILITEAADDVKLIDFGFADAATPEAVRPALRGYIIQRNGEVSSPGSAQNSWRALPSFQQ